MTTINFDDLSSPTLANVIRRYVDQVARGLHTMMPGRVISYDSNTQKAEIQPLIRLPVPGATTGDGVTESDLLEDLPVLPEVPIIFPRSKHSTIYYRIDPGTFVMLIFSMNSLEKFLISAGDAGTIDPQDPRHHNLSDAVALPGLFPNVNSLTDLVGDDIRIINDPPNGERSEVQIKGDSGDIVLLPSSNGTIQLGSDPGDESALLGETMNDELEALFQEFINAAPSFVTTGVGPGVLNPAVVTALTTFITNLITTLTTKVRVT